MKLVCSILAAGLGAAHDPLGPGASSTWTLTDPSEVGLSASALIAATAEVGTVGTHYCLAVVKNGALVVNKNYATRFTGGRPRKMESMSAAKTVTSIVLGHAMQAGLVDLDVPLIQYGVTPLGANWSNNPNGTDFFPNVTARHLLAQASGVGRYAPGTALTYDSDNYIQHLSFLVNATASATLNMTARAFAAAFAAKLGLPSLYAWEGADPAARGDTPTAADGGAATQFSAGGDQPMTCVDMARFGQLVLNDGAWRAADGKSVAQLLSREYVAELFTPQDTKVERYADDNVCVGTDAGMMCDEYSLLATVTVNNSKLVNESACDTANSGSVRVLGLPDKSVLALGSMGKYLVVVPEENLTFVSFGSHVAKFPDCAKRAGGTWASEEGIILSAIWRALGNATRPGHGRAQPAAAALALPAARARAAPSPPGAPTGR